MLLRLLLVRALKMDDNYNKLKRGPWGQTD